MKEYILRSDCEFLVNITENEYILNKYNSYTLKVEENEEDTILKVYPLFNVPKSLPFCFRLNCLTDNVKKTDLNGITILDILPYKILSVDEISGQNILDYNGEKIIVTTSESKILVLFKDKRISVDCENAKCFDFKIDGSHLVGFSESQILIVDLETGEYTIEQYEKLNSSNESYEILQNLNDYSGHLRVKSLNFIGKNIEQKSELYYKNNKPNIATNEDIIPMVVLDLVKLGDLELAKTYISNAISLGTHQLKEYFGDYDCYEILNGEYYLIKDNRAYKKLKFILNNKVIIDIEDENLY